MRQAKWVSDLRFSRFGPRAITAPTHHSRLLGRMRSFEGGMRRQKYAYANVLFKHVAARCRLKSAIVASFAYVLRRCHRGVKQEVHPLAKLGKSRDWVRCRRVSAYTARLPNQPPRHPKQQRPHPALPLYFPSIPTLSPRLRCSTQIEHFCQLLKHQSRQLHRFLLQAFPSTKLGLREVIYCLLPAQ
jgi:hypothetical protein